MNRLYTVIPFTNKRFPAGAKNAGIAALWRELSTRLENEGTSRNRQVIFGQIL